MRGRDIVKKFYVIIIDSGWPTVAHEVLQSAKNVMNGYLSKGQDLIEFSEKESQDFLRRFPKEIGKDPIIIITHLDPKKNVKGREKELIKRLDGIRIDLGDIKDRNTVLRYLLEICKLIKDERFLSDMSWAERRELFGSVLRNVTKDFFSKIVEVIL